MSSLWDIGVSVNGYWYGYGICIIIELYFKFTLNLKFIYTVTTYNLKILMYGLKEVLNEEVQKRTTIKLNELINFFLLLNSTNFMSLTLANIKK